MRLHKIPRFWVSHRAHQRIYDKWTDEDSHVVCKLEQSGHPEIVAEGMVEREKEGLPAALSLGF